MTPEPFCISPPAPETTPLNVVLPAVLTFSRPSICSVPAKEIGPFVLLNIVSPLTVTASL